MTERESRRRTGVEAPPEETPAAETGGEESNPEMPQGYELIWLDPRDIEWPEHRIRSRHTDESRASLADNMASQGQEDPLVVRRLSDGRYRAAAGENRNKGAIARGQAKVMCVVREGTEDDVDWANARTALHQSEADLWSEIDYIGYMIIEKGASIDDFVAIAHAPKYYEDRLAIYQGAGEALVVAIQQGMIATIGIISLLASIEDLEEQEREVHHYLEYPDTIEGLRMRLFGDGDGGKPAEPEGSSPPDPGTHEVNFNASNEPRQPQAEAVKCSVCDREDETGDTRSITLCAGCIRATQDLRESPKLQRGITPVPNDDLIPLLTVGADNPISARAAERVRDIMEAADKRTGGAGELRDYWDMAAADLGTGHEAADE